MEDLVLNSLHLDTASTRSPMNIATKRVVENSVSHATRTSTRDSFPYEFSQPGHNSYHEDAAIQTATEILIKRPESPLQSISHLSLVRHQRNGMATELRQTQDSAADAKRSISSLRKLALRLAVRISVKEANIASHSKALAKARMNQYLLEQQSHVLRPAGQYSNSPTNSLQPNKPLPSIPGLESPTATITTYTTAQQSPVRFVEQWHDAASIQEVIDNGEDRLIKMDASRASLKEELDGTRKKLGRLFESQALLREKYNLEREKSKNLDVECKQTHARISNLEEEKRRMEEETVILRNRIKSVEGANVRLNAELDEARLERHNLEEDLGKVQSSKLTLEHQLQAAIDSKNSLEDQLNALKASSAIIKQELSKKLQALEDDSIQSAEATKALESARDELAEELRVANFRLCAAIDLEIQLRTQSNEVRDRERVLEANLSASRQKVEQLEEDLLLAHRSMAEMTESIVLLSAKLEDSDKAKGELEEVTRLALSSREEVEAHLREMEKDKAKVDVWLRTTREQLLATETIKSEVETEIQILRNDLAEVQQRNKQLETMVEKAEKKLNVVVEESTAAVNHLEAVVAQSNRERQASPQSSSDVEQQLIAHQKEIETLHRTNHNLMEKLDLMTKELVELKTGGLSPGGMFPRPTSRFTVSRSESRVASERPVSRLTSARPGSPPEVVAAEELYDLEVRQLRETRETFDRVVKSLRDKNTELDLLGKWNEADGEAKLQSPRCVFGTVDSTHDLTLVEPVVEGIGRAVAAMQPTLVAGHDAESEMGILEIPAGRVLRRSASEGRLGSWGESRTSRWTDSTSTGAHGHVRSHSDLASHHQDNVLSEREAILRVGFIASPSVSPISQKGTKWKELPSRPSGSGALAPLAVASQHNVSPRDTVNKKLPPIPRRPVARSRSLNSSAEKLPVLKRSKTTNDLKVQDCVWSLFPRPPSSVNIGRPSTATGNIPFSPAPSKQSFLSACPVQEKDTPPGPGLTDEKLDDLRAKTKVIMEGENPLPPLPPQPVSQVQDLRHLRIKKSLAKLTNLSKKADPTGGHSRNTSDGGNRIRSLFRRPSKVLKSGENSFPTQEHEPHLASSVGPILEAKPEPPRKPDPVSKVWPAPRSSPTRTQFGVFDPGSRQWVTPKQRTDSLGKINAISPYEAAVSSERLSSTTDRSYEDETSSISLAEKLEILRYKPSNCTFSTPRTSIDASHSLAKQSLTRADSGSSADTLQLQDRPRPWKPGQLLGLDAPPKDNGLDGTPLDDHELENFNFEFTPPFAHHENHSSDGSGYMSFESEQEARGPWKSLMKSVHVPSMLKRSVNPK